MLTYMLNFLQYYMIDLIKLILICRGIVGLPFHKKKTIHYITAAGILIQLLLFGLIDQSGELQHYIIALMVLLTVCLIFQGGLNKKIYAALLAYLIVLFLDACFSGVVVLTIPMTIDELMEMKWPELLTKSLNGISFGSVVLIKKYCFKQKQPLTISKRIYTMLFIGTGMGLLLVSGLMALDRGGSRDRINSLILAITVLATITYFSGCLILIFINESRNNFRMLSVLNQIIIDNRHNYYSMAGERQKEIRNLRHAMKNHLVYLQGLYQMGKHKELGEYLTRLSEETRQFRELLDCGNEIVNAIINDADSRFGREGIQIRTEGRFPSDLYIASTDLCIIFANAVTNAVEIIRRLKKSPGAQHYIDINISSFKNDLYIDIRNPISEGFMIPEGKTYTFEADHMKQRVEKYRGTLKFEVDKGMLTAHIYMNNS